MFDEKSSIWLEIYKKYIQIMFWLYIIAAVVLGIIGFADEFWITDEPFFDGLILLVGGCLVAFLHLVTNMLLLNFLNNVKIIRECVEKQTSSDNKNSSHSSTSYISDTKSSLIWNCSKCNSVNHNTTNYCEKCGTKKDNPKSTTTSNNTQWKCSKCGAINQNYVGTCGCGERKPN